MDGTKRKRYYCTHCKQDVSKTTFYDHKRLRLSETDVQLSDTSDSDFELDVPVPGPSQESVGEW